MVLNKPNQRHVPAENQILLSFLKDNLFKTFAIFQNSDFSVYLSFSDTGVENRKENRRKLSGSRNSISVVIYRSAHIPIFFTIIATYLPK